MVITINASLTSFTHSQNRTGDPISGLLPPCSKDGCLLVCRLQSLHPAQSHGIDLLRHPPLWLTAGTVDSGCFHTSNASETPTKLTIFNAIQGSVSRRHNHVALNFGTLLVFLTRFSHCEALGVSAHKYTQQQPNHGGKSDSIKHIARLVQSPTNKIFRHPHPVIEMISASRLIVCSAVRSLTKTTQALGPTTTAF